MTKEKAIENLNEIIESGWLISDMDKCTAIDACEMAIDAIEKLDKIKIMINNWANELDKQDSGAYYMEQIVEVLENEL